MNREYSVKNIKKLYLLLLASFVLSFPVYANDTEMVEGITKDLVLTLNDMERQHRGLYDVLLTIAREGNASASFNEKFKADGRALKTAYEKLVVLKEKTALIEDESSRELSAKAIDGYILVILSSFNDLKKTFELVASKNIEALKAAEKPLGSNKKYQDYIALNSALDLAFARKNVGLKYFAEVSVGGDKPYLSHNPFEIAAFTGGLHSARDQINEDTYFMLSTFLSDPDSYLLSLKLAFNDLVDKKDKYNVPLGQYKKVVQDLDLIRYNDMNYFAKKSVSVALFKDEAFLAYVKDHGDVRMKKLFRL